MFNRKLWSDRFSQFPPWRCPKCADGTLRLVEGSVRSEETGTSKANHSHEAFEPDWVENRFSALLDCSNVCGELVVISGSSGIETQEAYDEEFGLAYEHVTVYRPALLEPSPSVLEFPKGTPEAVRREIGRASALIWLDIGSSANKLRSAAEELLTALKIARFVRKPGKKLRPIAFAQRLAKLSATHAKAASLLESIRFLGNVGTHESPDSVDRNDLLDGFEIFDHVLEDLYDPREERIVRKAKSIAKRKGKKAVKKKKKRL